MKAMAADRRCFCLTAGALVALTCATACATGDDASAWDEGVYHVTVELDTADPLSDSDNGDTSSTAMIADVLRDRLELKVYQYEDAVDVSCASAGFDLVVEMQAWVGAWSADLLLPERETCFYVFATILPDEVDIGADTDAESIYCSTTNTGDRSVRSEGGVEVSVDLDVACEWRSEGECEGC